MSDQNDRPVTGPDDEVDPLVREILGLVAAQDPVPEHVQAAARAVYTWRTIDDELAELAELSYDSLERDDALVGIRGTGARRLTFEWPGGGLDVEVTETGPGRLRLVGQLIPPGPSALCVEQGQDQTAMEADDLGRFVIEGLRPGPARLHWGTADEAEHERRTEWFLL